MIEINGLCIKYDKVSVLENVDISIIDNEINIIEGKNGIGKSSLLNFICNILDKKYYKYKTYINDFTYHSYLIDKYNIKTNIKSLNYLNLFTNKTFNKNILKEYFIDNKRISLLSNGNMQKLQILSTLLKEADLYILDEPFIMLDTLSKDKMITLLKLKKQEGKTIIVTTHDIQAIKKLKGNIINL